MATYDDIKDDIKAYWQQVWDALQAIVAELNRGVRVDDKRLDTLYGEMRPLRPGEFACSFCDRTKESYNLVNGTIHTQTFEDMCAGERCPVLETCRRDARKWQIFQCFACIWYFKEGQYFPSEGNRYPLCQRSCAHFDDCEAEAPTDTVNFNDLSEEAKKTKLRYCLMEAYRVGTAGDFAGSAINSWGGQLSG